MRLHGWRSKKVAEKEELLRKREKEEHESNKLHESNELHEIGETPAKEPVKKGCLSWIIDVIFPILTSEYGQVKLTRKRSCLILLLFYSSRIFSAWSDRMWNFANSLVVVLLYPGSLLMPGVYGFSTRLLQAIFGTIVGDYVDTNPRLRVIWVCLIVQNGFVLLSTILFSVMFYFQWDVCGHTIIFGSLIAIVLLSSSISSLATIGNTIAIEKDWVVVIADYNNKTLALLNANLRRIDLLCKLFAPVVAGLLLSHTHSLVPFIRYDLAGGFAATVIIGLWNIVSYFGELSLLTIVYKLIPSLADKKLRDKDKKENGEGSSSKCIKLLKKLASPYRTLIAGWHIYWKQETNLAGFSLASIFLTVLGFSGVTATYLLTQGLSTDYIGLAQGLGGLFGILGTIFYPLLQRRIGTVRTGLFGITFQIVMLLFCVVGVFSPGKPTSDTGIGYYSPNCSGNSSTISPSSTALYSSLIYPSPSLSLYSEASPSPSVTPPAEGSNGGFNINISIILILVGVIGARFGLWMFDLSIWQLVQEKVVVEERGVVSGVINALNSNMDMLHYVMVIAAPRPSEFPYLTIISFFSIFVGWILYCCYLRRVRGHLFHNPAEYSCCRCCDQVDETSKKPLSVANHLQLKNDGDKEKDDDL
ncbi:PREDICTED: solute carrier family 40 member 1-like [Amphimedon queenslandica]|uniref:Solute carrier family 40 member n=1 Tax=Amphimedon queenslandica TaxID=400682 RepID=A0AAN0J2I7_AMPQE|nr:PREDICTED: solute carrier family 40 member 1-like [Amphimedon queenslandica]|eukprot:XP_019851220.1 PREDICTED: solute carrier family 40 member 1-like [Amphimedon queenslandica]